MKFLLGSGYAIVPISDTTILLAAIFALYVSLLRNLLLWNTSPVTKEGQILFAFHYITN